MHAAGVVMSSLIDIVTITTSQSQKYVDSKLVLLHHSSALIATWGGGSDPTHAIQFLIRARALLGSSQFVDLYNAAESPVDVVMNQVPSVLLLRKTDPQVLSKTG